LTGPDRIAGSIWSTEGTSVTTSLPGCQRPREPVLLRLILNMGHVPESENAAAPLTSDRTGIVVADNCAGPKQPTVEPCVLLSC
jgi:hypothetical protein